MVAWTYLSLLAGAASALYVPSVDLDVDFDESAIEERAGCPKLQLVVAGGEGTTQGDLGYLDTTIAGIQAAIPGASLYQIGYPAGYASPQAIAYGIPKMRAYVNNFAAQCPDSKMFLVGYSAGAAVVMDTLCGNVDDGSDPLPIALRHNIIGEVVYGDPTYLPGLSYDKGTCTSSPGDVPRVDPHACFPFGKKLRSYCDETDNVCCGGDDLATHFSYPGIYDGDVATFAKAKWAYYNHHKNDS